MFVLKSSFRQNSIGSLHAYVFQNSTFNPQEIVALAPIKHAKWYMAIRDIDAMREKAGRRIIPRLLRNSFQWIEGLICSTGEFTTDPEVEGTPAVLGWQYDSGDPPRRSQSRCVVLPLAQMPTSEHSSCLQDDSA